MKTVLLIIDLQEEFFRDGLLAEHRERIVTSVNGLVEAARKNSIPVIWVRQELKADLSDAPLYNKRKRKPVTVEGTEGVLLLHELHRDVTDYAVVKKRFSAFFGTDLEALLSRLGIGQIVVCGINTMTCVRTTSIDAYQRDYEVILALDAVDAYDVAQHENSLTYLQYSVARGMHDPEIIAVFESKGEKE